jgi:hypothetical protein
VVAGSKFVSALSPGAALFQLDLKQFSRDPAALAGWLDTYVHGVRDRGEYVERLGGLGRLRADTRVCAGVNYGF